MSDPAQPVPIADTTYSLVGGQLCLDFVNTVDFWSHDPAAPTVYAAGDDEMPTYAHLLAWARQAGAIPADVADRLGERALRQPAEAERVMRRARRFREVLHALLAASMHGVAPKPKDVAVLNKEAVALLAAARLVPLDDAYQLSCPGETGCEADPAATALDRPLWPVVRSALALLTTPDDLAKVGECANNACGWVFLDRSGRRRWCSMAGCGTTAKVRRYRSRRKGGDGLEAAG